MQIQILLLLQRLTKEVPLDDTFDMKKSTFTCDELRQTVCNDQTDNVVTTHCVIFKCIGTMKEKIPRIRYQELLLVVVSKLRKITCTSFTKYS